MYKDTYTQEDVNKLLEQIKESIDREIDAAINSNYAAINGRSARGVNVYEDWFCQHCQGKIYALSGIGHYIDEMIDELVGNKK